jgi:hypothetical protein
MGKHRDTRVNKTTSKYKFHAGYKRQKFVSDVTITKTDGTTEVQPAYGYNQVKQIVREGNRKKLHGRKTTR